MSCKRNRTLSAPVPLAICMALLCPVVLGDSASDDLRNERLPSTTTQREQHWQVDCTRLRRLLLNYPGGAMRVTSLVPYLDAIEKCAMIHNVPGTPAQHSCPNYGQVFAVLNTALDKGARTIKRTEISVPLDCK